MKGIDIAHELVNLHNFMKYKSDQAYLTIQKCIIKPIFDS